MVKNPPANAGDIRDVGSVLGLGRSAGEKHGNPLQYSCLESPMDRGTWWATVHGVAKSPLQLKQLSTHAHHRRTYHGRVLGKPVINNTLPLTLPAPQRSQRLQRQVPSEKARHSSSRVLQHSPFHLVASAQAEPAVPRTLFPSWVPGGAMVRHPPANARDAGSIPESERSSGGGKSKPFQYCCLENSRRAWRAIQFMGSQRVRHD